jgi:hypothetical protein
MAGREKRFEGVRQPCDVFAYSCRFRQMGGTAASAAALGVTATTTTSVLEKPISRIRETCEMMGVRPKFDRALPELETYLESQVANGESSETRLTYNGLCYLKQLFAS